MSTDTVHDFSIPHEFVEPTRDMVIIRLPFPPEKVGEQRLIIAPEMSRDLAKHNVIAGRIVAMGPLAFAYKDAEGGIARQNVKKGDWVTIRPYSGTHVQGGKVQSGGFRYVSSFQDVIGIIPADKMPDPTTLLWEFEELEKAAKPAAKQAESFGGVPRERVKVA
jgi:co-chaperonin GroES (HSP10)